MNKRRNINREHYRRVEYIRRTAIVRRERFILASLFIVIFLFSILFFTNKTSANNFAHDSNSVKLYKSVTIYAGDTLESIASDYMSDEYSSVVKYVNELLAINSMNSDTVLIPGNKIIVPYYMSKSIAQNPVIEISLAQ